MMDAVAAAVGRSNNKFLYLNKKLSMIRISYLGIIQVRRDEVVGLPAPHLPGGEADQSQNQELLKSFPRTCENFERIERGCSTFIELPRVSPDSSHLMQIVAAACLLC